MRTVRLEQRGSVLLITLDRPQVLNAVNGAMTGELGHAIDVLERSSDTGVGVITGAGTAFCAGLDMKAVAGGSSIDATRHPEWGFAGITARRIRKPLVAAVNGPAVGGGLEIALACDLIVAAAGAPMGLPEVKHGVFAAGGGALRLTQQLPQRIARELLLTGRLITAEIAHSWGLVNAVIPAPDVLSNALGLAQEIAENAPLAVQATKRVLEAAGSMSPADPSAIAVIDAEADRVFASLDATEGITAFAEGRRPSFVGR